MEYRFEIAISDIFQISGMSQLNGILSFDTENEALRKLQGGKNWLFDTKIYSIYICDSF